MRRYAAILRLLMIGAASCVVSTTSTAPEEEAQAAPPPPPDAPAAQAPQRSHDAEVGFSSHGRWAYRSADGVTRLYDLAQRRSLLVKGEVASSGAFSKGESRVMVRVAGDLGPTHRVVDLDTGREVLRTTDPSRAAVCSFDDDSDTEAHCSSTCGHASEGNESTSDELCVLSVATGRHECYRGYECSMDIGETGAHWLSGEAKSTWHLLLPGARRPIDSTDPRFLGRPRPSFAISADARTLVVGRDSRCTAFELPRLREKTSWAHDCASPVVSKDGAWIASLADGDCDDAEARKHPGVRELWIGSPSSRSSRAFPVKANIATVVDQVDDDHVSLVQSSDHGTSFRRRYDTRTGAFAGETMHVEANDSPSATEDGTRSLRLGDLREPVPRDPRGLEPGAREEDDRWMLWNTATDTPLVHFPAGASVPTFSKGGASLVFEAAGVLCVFDTQHGTPLKPCDHEARALGPL